MRLSAEPSSCFGPQTSTMLCWHQNLSNMHTSLLSFLNSEPYLKRRALVIDRQTNCFNLDTTCHGTLMVEKIPLQTTAARRLWVQRLQDIRQDFELHSKMGPKESVLCTHSTYALLKLLLHGFQALRVLVWQVTEDVFYGHTVDLSLEDKRQCHLNVRCDQVTGVLSDHHLGHF